MEENKIVFSLNIFYFSICLSSNKLYWIEDQLADVSTQFYMSVSWRWQVEQLATWLDTIFLADFWAVHDYCGRLQCCYLYHALLYLYWRNHLAHFLLLEKDHCSGWATVMTGRLDAIWIAILALPVGLVRTFITWKSSMRWITSFLVRKKINIHFTDCLCFYKSFYVYCSLYLFCFILQAFSTVLSTTFSWLFCLLLFKHVIHTYSTAKAQDSPCSLCRPGWPHEYQGTFLLISGDVTFSGIWGKLHVIPVIILKNKGCFVPVTADTVRIKLTWKFCKLCKI